MKQESEKMFSMDFGDLPEELQNLLQQAAERSDKHDMAREDWELRYKSFLKELNQEDLTIIRTILHLCASDSSGRIAAYHEGVLSSIGLIKYDLCIHCSNKHTDDMEEFVKEAAATSSDTSDHSEWVNIPVQDETPKDDTPKDEHDFDPQSVLPFELTMSEEDRKNMIQYNLDDLRDPDTFQLVGFICRNCEYRYPSIEDRMLTSSSASGCTGCINKAKWG